MTIDVLPGGATSPAPHAAISGVPGSIRLWQAVAAAHAALTVELEADGLTVSLPPAFRAAVGATTGGTLTLGIRPEHLDVVPSGGLEATTQAKADVVEYLGNEELLHVIVAGVDIVAVVSAERNVRPGDVVTLHIPLDKIHLFDGTSEASLLRSRTPAAS